MAHVRVCIARIATIEPREFSIIKPLTCASSNYQQLCSSSNFDMSFVQVQFSTRSN